MILFLGCSLTWGQGLQIEKWISEGKTIDFCNRNTEPAYDAGMYSYEDDEYRKEKHYPRLVSKELNCSYSTQITNGGSNENNVRLLDNIQKCKIGYEGAVELTIVQFTDFTREIFYHQYIKDNHERVPHIKSYVLNQITHIDNITKGKWIGLSWPPEYSNAMKQYFPDKHIKIKQNDKTYNCIKDWLEKNKRTNLELCDKYDGVIDGHLSSEGHEVLAKSILEKIKEQEVEFTKYN